MPQDAHGQQNNPPPINQPPNVPAPNVPIINHLPAYQPRLVRFTLPVFTPNDPEIWFQPWIISARHKI